MSDQTLQKASSFPLAPGPKGIPILGQGLRFYREQFRMFVWMRESFGDVVRDVSAAMPIVQIFSPEAIEQVLVRNAKNYTKDRVLRSWNLVFGDGLLVSEGETWKHDRKVIQPAFSPPRLREYEAMMIDQSKKLAGDTRWSPGGQIDVFQEMTELTLRIVLRSLFGEESNANLTNQEFHALSHALEELANWFEFSSGPWMFVTLLFPWFPLPARFRYKRAVKTLEKYINTIIERKRVELKEGNQKGTDLITSLLTASDFTDKQVRDHALTFILAGHETTSLTLTYTLRLLAIHPEIQDELHAELLKIAPRGESPSHEALFRCELLSQVIDESMRLYPPAPVLAREATVADVVGGFQIVPTSSVIIPTWAIHRDRRYYGDDVDVFRPARWTPEFRKALPRAVFLPFGFGPRMCIGMGFAIQEIKIILAEILLKHKFTIDDPSTPMRLQASITMRPRDPVLLRSSGGFSNSNATPWLN